MLLVLSLQILGKLGLYQASLRPADCHGLQDCSGGIERPGEHTEAWRAGSQPEWDRHQPVL